VGQVVGEVGRVGLQVAGVDRLERGGDGDVQPARRTVEASASRVWRISSWVKA
jgi:hypothetical protein